MNGASHGGSGSSLHSVATNGSGGGNYGKSYIARREAEKAAPADAHINQLRMVSIGTVLWS